MGAGGGTIGSKFSLGSLCIYTGRGLQANLFPLGVFFTKTPFPEIPCRGSFLRTSGFYMCSTRFFESPSIPWPFPLSFVFGFPPRAIFPQSFSDSHPSNFFCHHESIAEFACSTPRVPVFQALTCSSRKSLSAYLAWLPPHSSPSLLPPYFFDPPAY